MFYVYFSHVSTPSNLRIVVATKFRLTGGRTHEVSKVNVHEAYNTYTLINDIALLVTEKDFSFGKDVSPIPYAPANFALPSGTEALVSGFGRTLVSFNLLILFKEKSWIDAESCFLFL